MVFNLISNESSYIPEKIFSWLLTLIRHFTLIKFGVLWLYTLIIGLIESVLSVLTITIRIVLLLKTRSNVHIVWNTTQISKAWNKRKLFCIFWYRFLQYLLNNYISFLFCGQKTLVYSFTICWESDESEHFYVSLYD